MTHTYPIRDGGRSVAEYVEAIGVKKTFQAARWGISRFQMTALIHPGRYALRLNDDQWRRIAADLNRDAADLRKQYDNATSRPAHTEEERTSDRGR